MRLMFAGVALGLAGCAAPAPQPVDVSAKSAVLADRFQADLQGQLQAAMKAGGPVSAIGVCQQAAPAIAANLSEESGAEVRRIALMTYAASIISGPLHSVCAFDLAERRLLPTGGAAGLQPDGSPVRCRQHQLRLPCAGAYL